MSVIKYLFIAAFAGVLCACATPYYFWSQTDTAPVEVNSSDIEIKVLIASRQSDFKTAVIERIQEAFQEKDVYIKIIGLEGLKTEDAAPYSAIVLINTSMAWSVDPLVETFVNAHAAATPIIVLTTSNGGDIYPDLEDRDIDAIASASTPGEIAPIADQLIEKISTLLKT
jgi:hypothetical protein